MDAKRGSKTYISVGADCEGAANTKAEEVEPGTKRDMMGVEKYFGETPLQNSNNNTEL